MEVELILTRKVSKASKGLANPKESMRALANFTVVMLKHFGS
ncbi:MAG: hypothetical protein P3X22_006870 [Thermoprotei archaeon]|nr:hypothetical protein [Thermoprotei archaeon]